MRGVLFKAGLKARHAARKPMLTDRMKAQRMEFATSHLHWTPEVCSKVSFADESTYTGWSGEALSTSGGARGATC